MCAISPTGNAIVERMTNRRLRVRNGLKWCLQKRASARRALVTALTGAAAKERARAQLRRSRERASRHRYRADRAGALAAIVDRAPATRQTCYNRPAVRILLVDDDPSATRLYRTMLVNEGHDVVALESGVEAVEAALRERFDLVITDFNMPGIKGDVTLSLLHARLPDLPVVILTSEPSAALEKRARDAGAAAFLRKPCSADVLSRTIARCRRPSTAAR